MTIPERILRFLSKKEVAEARCDPPDYVRTDPLWLMRNEFPQFSELVRKKEIADFGCGPGHQAIALALQEECVVCGIDNNLRYLELARSLASRFQLTEARITFVEKAVEQMKGRFDVVMSQNAIEHFADPAAIISEMKGLLRPTGKILITFGPPWFAPYGSHMQFFCSIPWLNLLFSEKTILNVRSIYRDDGAKRFEDVDSGLNKITLRRFEQIILESKLQVEYLKYSCVKGFDFLGSVPLLRELFVNHVTCVLCLRTNKEF